MGAGEIGHIVVAENGRSCTCGNRGCLETVASTAAILVQARKVLGQPDLTWEALVAQFKDGEAVITNLITTTGHYLGKAIASLVGGYNIHHIVITGRIGQFGQPLLDVIQAEMQGRVMPALADQTAVSFSSFGDEVVILGCSAMILHEELGII
jgi:predicted NBD/HSP70 family sugar kinase